MELKNYIASIINGKSSVSLVIKDNNNTTLGELRPIVKSSLQEEIIIQKLTDWRNRNKQFFLTQFEATTERTKTWLDEVVLADNSRLLFLIYVEEKLIGHYGFKDLEPKSAFLDNALRGERGGHPQLMKYAATSLIGWLFNQLGVEKVYGYTFANNPMGLRLNKEIGFEFLEKIPLIKQADAEETSWKVGEIGEISPDNHYYQKLVMYRGKSLS